MYEDNGSGVGREPALHAVRNSDVNRIHLRNAISRCFTLGVIIVLCTSNILGAQLLPEAKDAEEALDHTLSLLDEQSLSYISRFKGTLGTLDQRDGSLSFFEICGCSVEQKTPIRGEYHCFGTSQLADAHTSERIFWHDALRAGGKVLYRAGVERADGSTPAVNVKEGASWRLPEIDPFGLPFAAEGDFDNRGTQFESKLGKLLAMEFVKSERIEGGIVRGSWIKSRSYRVIDFDSKQNYLPVKVKYFIWDPATKRRGPLFIENTLTWQESGKVDLEGDEVPRWVPVKFNGKYAVPPPGSYKTEIQLELEWVEVKKLAECDLVKLAKDPPINLRRHFDEFFPGYPGEE